MPYLNKKLNQLLTPLTDFDEPPPDVELLQGYIANGTFEGETYTDMPALMLVNNAGEQVNALIYKTPSYYTYLCPHKGEALLLGELPTDGTVYVCYGTENALLLHKHTQAAVVFLPTFHQSSYSKLINHFGERFSLTVFDNYLNKATIKELLGLSTITGQLVLTVDEIGNVLEYGEPLDELLKQVIPLDSQWGEIEPLSTQTKRQNPYPIHAFGALAEVVKAIADYAQTPLSMAGQSVLGAISTIGQAYINAPMGNGYKPASLFLLTEAPSGAGKSEVMKLAYHAIEAYDKATYKAFIDEMDDYNRQARGKAGADFRADNAPPINRQLMSSDATTESLLQRYINDGIYNQTLGNDDAGQFFNGYSMQADTAINAIANFTNLYSGGKINVVRSKRGANKGEYKTTAYDCRLTMDLQAQPIVIGKVMDNEVLRNQGFLARFLFSCEPSLIGKRDWQKHLNQDPYNDLVLKSYWERCSYLLAGEPHPFCDDGTPNRYNMPFGEGARVWLANYQQAIENAQNGLYKDVAAFACRMAENTARVGALLAFFDGQRAVTIHYLYNASLLCEYSIKDIMDYGEQHSQKSDGLVLLEWLIKKASNHTLAKAFVSQNAPNHLRGKKLSYLLDDLESGNYIKQISIGRRKVIQINPNL